LPASSCTSPDAEASGGGAEAKAREPGIHHDGKLVLGEAIGDLAGAHIAYRALQKACTRARSLRASAWWINEAYL
jgi:hypothetical protein